MTRVRTKEKNSCLLFQWQSGRSGTRLCLRVCALLEGLDAYVPEDELPYGVFLLHSKVTRPLDRATSSCPRHGVNNAQ